MRRILVAGTGPVGLIAALAFARSGFEVTLAGPERLREDRRTTALMVPALRFLETLGIEVPLLAGAAPLRVMQIVDATGRLIRSLPVTFRAAELGEPWFGMNIPNLQLWSALRDAVVASPAIDWRGELVAHWDIAADGASAALADGSPVEGCLAVAADGRNSPARQAAGISVKTRPYAQAALVLNFAHSQPHGDVSTEFHTETGPFTQVPLSGDRSSLVWVERPAIAEMLYALSDEELSMRIESKMQSLLGRVAIEPGRQVHPLSTALPSAFARRRIALVGEAAHAFPPIGAQGLNLGIRDVRQLIETAAQFRSDPGSEAALSAYDRRRRPDILARTGAVTLLNESLLSELLPAQMLRSAGLGLLGAVAPLRSFFMREGLEPGSGFASLLRFRERDRAEALRS